MAQTRKKPAGKAGAKGAARPAPPPKPRRALRPMLLAAGLGLYWFVEHRDGGEVDMPMWGYLTTQGVRVLVDFVGAWVVVSVVLLMFAVLRYGAIYARARWLPESR